MNHYTLFGPTKTKIGHTMHSHPKFLFTDADQVRRHSSHICLQLRKLRDDQLFSLEVSPWNKNSQDYHKNLENPPPLCLPNTLVAISCPPKAHRERGLCLSKHQHLLLLSLQQREGINQSEEKKKGFLVPMEGHTDPESQEWGNVDHIPRCKKSQFSVSVQNPAFLPQRTLFRNQYDITVLPFTLLLNNAGFL